MCMRCINPTCLYEISKGNVNNLSNADNESISVDEELVDMLVDMADESEELPSNHNEGICTFIFY